MLKFISQIIYNWYFLDSKTYWNEVILFIKFMDRDLGVIANIYNWTSPLYGDYSLIGKAIGPILRTLRIFVGGLAHLIILIIAFFLFIFWLALPLGILAMIFLNLMSLYG